MFGASARTRFQLAGHGKDPLVVIIAFWDNSDGSEPSDYFRFLPNPLNKPDCDRIKWVKMMDHSRPSILIDLNEFKLHLHLKNKTQRTFYFDSPSRRFYLCLIALVVNEMKKSGKIKSIPLLEHLHLLALVNESVGGAAGSSDRKNLLPRIYRKWKSALPNLEEAPLFKVLGKKKDEGDGATGKVYPFTDAEKDDWANLFDYTGSEENVRLKFAVDKIGIRLDETSIVFGDSVNGDAWGGFISSLKKGGEGRAGPDEENAEEHVVTEPAAVPLAPPRERKISLLNQNRWVLLAVVIVIAAVGIGTIYWRSATTPVASLEKMKYPLPDKPSIAVLPFVNMSDDPRQEYFSDGITEEVITALSKLPNLFVIARNSTFTFKGKAVKVNQIAEELGVRYVLEGSVRRTGEKVRIAAQLIDALSGHHLWAERYDRDMKDIFVLQDEITLNIIAALQVKLTTGGMARIFAKGTRNLDAYIKVMQFREQFERMTKEGRDAAKKLAEEIIALDPKYPRGYALLAAIHNLDFILGLSESPQQSLSQAFELEEKALSLDNSLSYAHALLGHTYVYTRQYDKAVVEGKRAVALDPNSAENLCYLAWSLCHADRAEEAISLVESAARLNPIPFPLQLSQTALAYRSTGRYEKAIELAERAIKSEPKYLYAHINLIASYMALGREKEALADAAELLRMYPKESIINAVKRMPYKNRAENVRIADALYRAGVK
jgi:adenylate cyclase